MQATLLLLRFFKDFFNDDKKLALKVLSDEESEPENYTNLIQESKHLLDTLSYQKNRLENLNQEFSSRGAKLSPTGSPSYRGNLTVEKVISPELKKDQVSINNFHTANKIAKSLTRFKTNSKK